MTTPQERIQTQVDYIQKEIVCTSVMCKDMIEHTAMQYGNLTKELSNAMWGWYNIKPEDTENV